MYPESQYMTMHTTLKLKEISRSGPSPLLTETEGQELVHWAIQMSDIGYGQCNRKL